MVLWEARWNKAMRFVGLRCTVIGYCVCAMAQLLTSAVHLPQGSASYAPEKSALVWHMRNFPGGKEFMLR